MYSINTKSSWDDYIILSRQRLSRLHKRAIPEDVPARLLWENRSEANGLSGNYKVLYIKYFFKTMHAMFNNENNSFLHVLYEYAITMN